jgi:signal peptidase I
MDYGVLQAARAAWEGTGKRRRFRMIGDSMSPFIQDGDGVVVEHGSTDIKIGDVILYQKPSLSRQAPGVVVHRVVQVLDEGMQTLFVTRGDNRPLPDPPIGRRQILGKVVGVKKTGGLSPEDRLLLGCARTEMDEGTIKEVWDLLKGELDWGYLIAAAVRHAIPQLLYHNLKALGTERVVPPGVLGRLERMYYANALRHLRFSQALEDVLGAFKEIGIKAIILKGMALATQVYPVAALRQCGDIDVLVEKEDLLRAEEALLGLGYTAQCKSHVEKRFGQQPHHLSYLKDEGRIGLEVHWDLAPQPHPFFLPLSELWARAEPFRVGSVEVLALEPVDLLIHLSLHTVSAFYFLWVPGIDLRHLCDIAEMTQVYLIHWDKLITRAWRYRTTRNLYIALYLARRMLQARVPQHVLEALQPNDLDSKWLAGLEERVLKRRYGSASVPLGLVHLLLARGVADRLCVLREIFFPSPEAIAEDRGVSPTSRKVYWYYVTRPFCLLSRWGGFLLRFLTRDRWECSLFGVRSSGFSRSDSVEGD